MKDEEKKIINDTDVKENNISNNESDKDDIKENNIPDDEPDNITREINLDELYDGAINNTVVIDPVTHDEVLMTSRKPNYTFLGVLLSILILLIFYYISNKTEIGKEKKVVKPKTTISSSENKKEGKSGELTCNYLSKSDAESQTVTYNLRYENEKLLYSEFNYVVVSNLENTSEVVNVLINKYENFYINNSSNTANNITFEKNEKGFTFNVKTDYTKNNIELNEAGSETILYVSPSHSDTYLSLSDSYTNKGFTCSLTANDKK